MDIFFFFHQFHRLKMYLSTNLVLMSVIPIFLNGLLPKGHIDNKSFFFIIIPQLQPVFLFIFFCSLLFIRVYKSSSPFFNSIAAINHFIYLMEDFRNMSDSSLEKYLYLIYVRFYFYVVVVLLLVFVVANHIIA